MYTICLQLLNECEMHILHAYVITKVDISLFCKQIALGRGSYSQDNESWKPYHVLLFKQSVLAGLLHHSFEQWQVDM